MKNLLDPSKRLLAPLLVLGLMGCSSTKLSVDVEGPQIAESIGVEIEDLEFISNGDVIVAARPEDAVEGATLMEAAPHQYSPESKGIFAVSNDGIYWALQELDQVKPEDFQSIPLTDIEAIQRIPESALLVRTSEQDIILRAHSWTKFDGDEHRLDMLRSALVDQGVTAIATPEEEAASLRPKSFEWDRFSNRPNPETKTADPDPFGHFR